MRVKAKLKYHSIDRKYVYQTLASVNFSLEIVKDKCSELDVSSIITLIIDDENLMKLLYLLNQYARYCGVHLIKTKKVREKKKKNIDFLYS